MKRIQTIYKMITKRLPNKYSCPVRFYKTSTGILRAIAKEIGKSYTGTIKYYNRYLKKNDKNYIKTGLISTQKNRKKEYTAHDIAAFGGSQIWICEANVNRHYRTNVEIALLLLHEMRHHVQKNVDEHDADLFAIRWTKQLIIEGKLK